MQAIGGVKSKETRSYQKGKCNSPIFSTETIYAYKCAINIGLLHFPSDKILFPCFLHHQMYMVPVREPLFPLGSRKIRKKVLLQLRIDYHILVVCFCIYDLWINKSMVEIANAGTLRELTLCIRTLT